MVLYQFEDREDLDALTRRIRDIPSNIQDVGGIPFTPYLSVGVSVFSEARGEADQANQAQIRMMTDDSEYASSNETQDNIAHLFRMFDHIPMPYAVYKVHFAPEGDRAADSGAKNAEPTDATLLYVNHAFCRMTGRERQELAGRKVRELFPMMGERWFQLAGRAAVLGEVVQDQLYYRLMDVRFEVTVNQVIGSGYCAFSYQAYQKAE